MIININEYIPTGKEQKETIIQANDGDKLFNIFLDMQFSPKSNEEIAEKYAFNKRQASYYASGLMAMGLVDVFKYHSKRLFGLNKKGLKIVYNTNPKEFAEFLNVSNFIKRQKILLAKSNLAKETKSRRSKGINSLEKWIERKLNEK